MFKIIPADGKYLMVTNRLTENNSKYDCIRYRNVISLVETEDLENFTLVKDIINRDTESTEKVGFQYPAVLYENGEILLNIRSAFNNADTEHDSNYMLFGKA